MAKKEENISLFLQVALKNFIKDGIYEAKVRDIAKQVGITERTAFRYFETKTDMVFASLKLLWHNYLEKIEEDYHKLDLNSSTSYEKIVSVLRLYGNLYLTDAKQLLFVEEAESYLTRNGINIYENNRFPIDTNDISPLAEVLKDPSVIVDLNKSIDLELTYYNTFDGLLGFMQKLSVEFTNKRINEEKAKKRLEAFTSLLAKSFLK